MPSITAALHAITNIYVGAIARAYLPSREQHAFTRGDASTEEEAAAKRRAKIAE